MLTSNNIECELSYAYLHAVASRAGFGCKIGSRYDDEAGIDAIVSEDGRKLSPDSILTSFDLHVQLKATFVVPAQTDSHYSYSLTVPRYDKLRNPRVHSARILSILYLPQKSEDWLSHSEDSLISKRCAYWVSLRNAPESSNPKHQTIYIPRRQILSVDTLTALMTRLSKREEVDYEV